MIAWDRVVLNLRGAGLLTREIGKSAGLTAGRISQIASGQCSRGPSIEAALILLDLHLDHCPSKHGFSHIGSITHQPRNER